MAFYDNLLALCAERGEKLTPLVKSLGLSTGTITKWRNGATINSDILLAFATHFGVSVDRILTGNEPIPFSDPAEADLVRMYRALPPAKQEFIFDAVRAAYDKEASSEDGAALSG